MPGGGRRIAAYVALDVWAEIAPARRGKVVSATVLHEAGAKPIRGPREGAARAAHAGRANKGAGSAVRGERGGVRACAAFVLVAAGLSLARCAAPTDVGAVPGCLFGAHVTPSATGTVGDDDFEHAIGDFESLVGRGMDVDRQYYQFATRPPSARVTATIAAGRVPLLSWNTGQGEGKAPIRSWASVAAGDVDDEITTMASDLAELERPSFFIFHGSPENSVAGAPGVTPDLAFGTPGEFRAAFRRVATLVHARAGDAVRVVFSMKSVSYPHVVEDYYPGDDVVDWLSVSGYNLPAGATDARWETFEQVFVEFYDWALPHGKPMMIDEWASSAGTTTGQSRAQWFHDTLATLEGWPEIRVVSYFESAAGGAYSLASDEPSRAAFETLAHDPYFSALGAR